MAESTPTFEGSIPIVGLATKPVPILLGDGDIQIRELTTGDLSTEAAQAKMFLWMKWSRGKNLRGNAAPGDPKFDPMGTPDKDRPDEIAAAIAAMDPPFEILVPASCLIRDGFPVVTPAAVEFILNPLTRYAATVDSLTDEGTDGERQHYTLHCMRPGSEIAALMGFRGRVVLRGLDHTDVNKEPEPVSHTQVKSVSLAV